MEAPNPPHNFSSVLLSGPVVSTSSSCCRIRTRSEKLLLSLLVLVIGLSAGLVVVTTMMAVKLANNQSGIEPDSSVRPTFYHPDDAHNQIDSNHLMPINRSSTVCLTPGCVKAASEILDLIDETVDPCDDFYQFVCGGWIKSTPIPEDSGSISIFDQSRTRLDVQLKELIENSKDETPSVVTLKNMYNSCMDLDAIEDYGLTPLQESIEQFGGWPLLGNGRWNETDFDWIQTLSKMRSIGYRVDMFIEFKIVPDVTNNSRNILHMDEPVLGLRKQVIEQGANNSIVDSYHRLIVNSAMMLGAANRTRTEDEAWEIIELEKELAELMHDPNVADTKKAYYVNITSLIAAATHPEVVQHNQTRLGRDWVDYINAVLQLTDGNVSADETIITDNLQIIEGVDYVLSYLNVNNRRLLSNYIIWRVVLQSLSAGTKSMREMQQELKQQLYGITERPPRWKTCLAHLTGSMSFALSWLYIKNNFDRKSKASATHMVDYIKDEFINMINNVDWMDDETRKNALDKARAMMSIIGYPPELVNETLINQHYENLNLTENHFEANIRRLIAWRRTRDYDTLRQPNDPHFWKKYADSVRVNAFYQPQANSIIIPAGILRDVFFDADRPQYLNFGTIGYIIGHEITHGFDNVGSHFDGSGNARNWWLNETFESYNRKAGCMMHQYGNFTLANGLKVNGQYTLKENIADNGGVKQAFNAYTRYVKQFGEEPSLPGLKYTPRQLFWMAAAKNWCSKSTDQMFKTRLETDSHSPGQARVNVVMGNIKEFSQSFDCPKQSKMNPVKTCTVW